MTNRSKPSKVLIVGSGPTVTGQAHNAQPLPEYRRRRES